MDDRRHQWHRARLRRADALPDRQPDRVDLEVNSLGDATCHQAVASLAVRYFRTDGTQVETEWQTDGFSTVQRSYTDGFLLEWVAQVDYTAPCQTNCASPLFTGPK